MKLTGFYNYFDLLELFILTKWPEAHKKRYNITRQ